MPKFRRCFKAFLENIFVYLENILFTISLEQFSDLNDFQIERKRERVNHFFLVAIIN